MLKAVHILFWIVILSVGSHAQDIHYSQFFNSPLNLSPALTGMHNGDGRIHANYRSQWSGVPVGYTSADIGADLKHRFNDKGFLGYGLLLNYDQAGDLSLGWTGVNGFLSYSFKLGDKSLITPGVTLGYKQRSFDQGNATTGSQWTGKGVGTGEPEGIATDQIGFMDLDIGLNYRYQSSYRKHLDIGASLAHLNSPEQQFDNSGNYQVVRPRRLNIYGMLNYAILNDLDLLVNALYSDQGPYNEIVINGQGKIYLSKAKDKALFLGLGYRFDDALYPMIALQVGQLYGSFSYDLNVSNWDIASDSRGGPELSLRYIWSKVPDVAYQPCLIY